MTESSKFDFATVFTPGAPHPDDDPHALMNPADIPVYSQNQMDAALAEARNEGVVVATDEASQNADAIANQTLDQIHEHFARLGTFQDSIVTSIHSDAVQLALLVGKKLARSLMSREPKAEIESLILEMLQQHSEIGSAPKVLIRVHPVIAPNISSRIDTLKNTVAFTGEITVLPSENLGPTDCSVEWAEGGAVRNLKQLEDEVASAIKGYLGAVGGTTTPEVQVPQPTADQVTNEAPATAQSPQPQAQAPQQTSVIDEIAAETQQTAITQDQVS